MDVEGCPNTQLGLYGNVSIVVFNYGIGDCQPKAAFFLFGSDILPTHKGWGGRRQFFVIGRIHKRNIAILIIEHNIGMLMRLAQRIVVLDRGKKITEGRPDEIRKEKKVIKAYFGRRKCLV